MKAWRLIVPLLLCLFLRGSALCQNVGPADSQFIQSFGADSINLQSLAIGIDIPVISKVGPVPFRYDLVGLNGCQISNNGAKRYTYCGVGLTKSYLLPQKAWTLSDVTPSNPWSVSAGTVTPSTCAADNKPETLYSNLVLTGPDFTTYYLPPSDTVIVETGTGTSCNQVVDDYTYQGGVHAHITDIDEHSYGLTVTVPSGWTYGLSSAPFVKDTFGNEISFSNTTNEYTDTLGATFTAVGSAGYETDTYTDTTGAQQEVVAETLAATMNTTVTGCSYPTSQAGNLVTLITFPDKFNVQLGYELINAQYTGRLASIKLRTGDVISYTYAGSCPLFPTTITRTALDGTTSYTQAIFSSGSNFGTTTTVLDPGNNKTVYTFMGTGNDGLPVPFIPLLMTEKQVWQNTGTVSSPVYTLLSTDLYCYNGNATGCATSQSAYPIVQKDTYHTIGAMTTSSRVSQTFDKYGNMTSVANYGFGASQFTTETTITYGNWNGTQCVAIGSGVYNKPCHEVSSDGTNTFANTRYTYNTEGALTSVSRYTGTQWLTTSSVPNGNGTPASIKDPAGNTTAFGYAASGSGGCAGVLPTSATQGSLTSSVTWDCNGGVITSTTDPNNNSETFTFNNMLERYTATDESGYTKTFGYVGTVVIQPVVTFPLLSVDGSFGASVQDVATYIDGQGRPTVIQRQQGPSSANYDTESFTYGFNGVNWQDTNSVPCVQTKGLACTSNFAVTKDPLGRVLSSTDPLGGYANYTYTKQDTSVTVGPPPANEKVKTFQSEFDGLNRLVSTCALEPSGASDGAACGQVMGGSGVLTTFQYSFGPGTSTVVSTRGAESRTITKDGLGRTLKTITPEAGTTAYFWDTVPSSCTGVTNSFPGDLIATKDNAGVYTCYYYDNLNRVIGVGTSPTSDCYGFSYDAQTTPPAGITINNGLGHMIEAYTSSGCTTTQTTEWFSYDKNGRMTDMWQLDPQSSPNYIHTSVGYYPNGIPSSLSGLPGYPTITYGVEGEGRWSTATLGSTAIVSGTTYGAVGPTEVSIGSGTDEDEYTYDSQTGRLTQYQFFVGSQSNKGVLNWNTNGTLNSLTVTDGFNAGGSQSCAFTYDDLARLATDNCGSAWNQTFSFDQYDNLSKSNFNPGYNTKNQYTTIGATYDADGNLTYDGSSNNYTWNKYGKLLSINSTNIVNDAFGRPVVSGTSEILYSPLGQIAVLSGGTVSSAYVPMPGTGQLSLSGGTNYYLHKDWLGSVRVQSTVPGSGNGTVSYDRAFAPYGEQYLSFGSSASSVFAGLTSNIDPSLHDTITRELSNVGRWLSPDPSGAGWNGYAYATDPNRQTDPSGLWPKSSPRQTRGLQDIPYVDWGGGDWPMWALENTPPNNLPGLEGVIDFFLNPDNKVASGEQAMAAVDYSGADAGYYFPSQESLITSRTTGASSSWDTDDPLVRTMEKLMAAFGEPFDSVDDAIRITRLVALVAGTGGSGGGDWFYQPCPNCGHSLSELGEITNEVVEHKSYQEPGGALQKYGDQGCMGCSSMYFRKIDNSGAWRASDHTMFKDGLPAGLTPESAIRDFGGFQPDPVNDPNLWIFTKRPVVTWYPRP